MIFLHTRPKRYGVGYRRRRHSAQFHQRAPSHDGTCSRSRLMRSSANPPSDSDAGPVTPLFDRVGRATTGWPEDAEELEEGLTWRASRMCSRVWGIGPSAAFTTRIPPSICRVYRPSLVRSA
jgi:hypothetical protein